MLIYKFVPHNFIFDFELNQFNITESTKNVKRLRMEKLCWRNSCKLEWNSNKF